MAGRVAATDQIQPVWTDAEGTVLAAAVKPIYPSAVKTAREDGGLYDLLALVDALRLGRARERKFAEEELAARLKANA